MSEFCAVRSSARHAMRTVYEKWPVIHAFANRRMEPTMSHFNFNFET